jgi:hypothetical protein
MGKAFDRAVLVEPTIQRVIELPVPVLERGDPKKSGGSI